jgi:hypothetical protein
MTTFLISDQGKTLIVTNSLVSVVGVFSLTILTPMITAFSPPFLAQPKKKTLFCWLWLTFPVVINSSRVETFMDMEETANVDRCTVVVSCVERSCFSFCVPTPFLSREQYFTQWHTYSPPAFLVVSRSCYHLALYMMNDARQAHNLCGKNFSVGISLTFWI